MAFPTSRGVKDRQSVLPPRIVEAVPSQVRKRLMSYCEVGDITGLGGESGGSNQVSLDDQETAI